jgi:hypothetical protein|uniref:Uncharacterized protein n=1 Tax=Eutreptiella gymnastica TaxID=73025 RepID=A0A7S4GH80_9EUGL|mmetsp:Transcript_35096/g.58824  ORF Transcript_35096/g.58824 Transcript_35096/m.58824 type:complete len:124 (+) Transcript_35096:80-451(+)
MNICTLQSQDYERLHFDLQLKAINKVKRLNIVQNSFKTPSLSTSKPHPTKCTTNNKKCVDDAGGYKVQIVDATHRRASSPATNHILFRSFRFIGHGNVNDDVISEATETDARCTLHVQEKSKI